MSHDPLCKIPEIGNTLDGVTFPPVLRDVYRIADDGSNYGKCAMCQFIEEVRNDERKKAEFVARHLPKGYDVGGAYD